ncbi:MAG TPA: winged helix-turn-helix domain-containing protein, partial [Mucilaginibacter sp.]
MARRRQNNDLPTYDELMVPTIKALLALGGSGTVDEINNKVYEITAIPENILQIPHGEEGTTNEVGYRLAWSRTYLKKFGLLENSSRGIWALSKADIDITKIDPVEIKRVVKEQSRPIEKINLDRDNKQGIIQETEDEVENTEGWKDQLLNILYKIQPAAFERLAQRILRESGFFQVEVTGKSGDGGIDGKGIVRVSGL